VETKTSPLCGEITLMISITLLLMMAQGVSCWPDLLQEMILNIKASFPCKKLVGQFQHKRLALMALPWRPLRKVIQGCLYT
jgi:hypothetical protein